MYTTYKDMLAAKAAGYNVIVIINGEYYELKEEDDAEDQN